MIIIFVLDVHVQTESIGAYSETTAGSLFPFLKPLKHDN